MPQGKKASLEASGDCISALPDALLHRVPSFLEAPEAVRSSVLARRWRHLWKSLPVIRLTRGRSIQDSHVFLNNLLLLRDRCPMDACLLYFHRYAEGDGPYINLWIRYALSCHAQALSVAFSGYCTWDCCPLRHLRLVSENLTKLHLKNVRLNDRFLDLTSCPKLEELKMSECHICAGKIVSRSLKYLTIRACRFTNENLSNIFHRARISAPSLVSLKIKDVWGKTPLLEDMPLLETASVRFDLQTVDSGGSVRRHVNCGDIACQCCCASVDDDESDDEPCSDASCECCHGKDDGSAGCVLLKGLSAAADLKLIAKFEVVTLVRDLRWCPTFRKLKTLFLTEGCMAADHSALICILQHSPVLENLILELAKTSKPITPLKANYNLLNQSVVSKHLKVVEVTCEEIDQSSQHYEILEHIWHTC